MTNTITVFHLEISWQKVLEKHAVTVFQHFFKWDTVKKSNRIFFFNFLSSFFLVVKTVENLCNKKQNVFTWKCWGGALCLQYIPHMCINSLICSFYIFQMENSWKLYGTKKKKSDLVRLLVTFLTWITSSPEMA